jgi:NADPH-dependent curcumin reductase
MMTMPNRRVLLARRPQGAPRPDDFAVVDHDIPVAGPGQVLLRNLFLSLDPYMRGRMNAEAGSYSVVARMGGLVPEVEWHRQAVPT